jgi:hypothetical protein
MIVTAGAAGACSPIVGSKQAVLTLECFVANGNDGVIVGIEALRHIPQGKEQATILVLVHGKR